MESSIRESAVTARLNEQAEEAAERYFRRYREHIQLLENGSLLSKVRPITPYDYYALGRQLEAWESYKAMCEFLHM